MKENLIDIMTKLRWQLISLQLGGISDFPLMEEGAKAFSQQSRQHCNTPACNGEIPPDSESALKSIQNELGACTRCRLHANRTHIVFGEGCSNPAIVFVGEGPGQDEDQQGRPFVGKAGKLLDKMIRALGFAREQVYICNMVKCRPPNNRTPQADEIDCCSPFLLKQIDALRPQVICALGACAAQNLLGSASAISMLRSKVHSWRGMPLVATFHPAYLLRNPSKKAAAWQDLLQLRRILNP
jgi:uracil-DNA glycosylase